MTAQAKPDLNDAPALVLFKRDEAGKAHASWFTQSEAKLTEKAAALMNLRLLRVRTEAERALAAQVPRGRVFATGRAFLPFVKAALFLELQTAALNSGITPLKLITGPAASGGDQPKPAASTPDAPTEPPKGTGRPKQPCGWADIQVGAVVLSMDLPEYQDWYECEVLAVQGEDLFTLRWRYWPDLPPFVRRRVQLGLIHPACPPALPPDLI